MSRQIDKVQITQTVEIQANKGIANGYASLDATGKIPSNQIPSTGVNADTLDSLNSTQFLRSDANDDFSGTLNYTTDVGTVISFDGKAALLRHTAQGAISLGADDALVLGCGEARATTVANVNMVDEHTYIASDNNVYIYTAMQSGWASRNTFTFSGTTFNAPNIQENGTNLSSKYLGISAKAADSNLLDGIDSSSFLRSNAADTASSKITFATGLARSAHNVGHLEGSYNNVGANGSYSNPIYTIGSSYNPSTTTLGNMYGIGYANSSQASYLSWAPGTDNWGMYVAADGDARIFLNGGSGTIAVTSSFYEAGTALSAKYLGISATAADSAKLNGVVSNTAASNDTIVRRTSSGYIFCNYFNASNSDTGTAATRVAIGTSTDGYLRWQSKASFISGMGLLTTTAKAADSNLLDNLNYTSFARAGARTDNYVWVRRSSTSTSAAMYVTQQSSGYIQAWYQGSGDGTRRSYVASDGKFYAPDFIGTSDIRLKENIRNLDSYLETALKIADVARVYDRIDTKEKGEIGFVAQELEEIAPDFVSQENDDYKGVKYARMVVPLYKTIQEQQQLIDENESQITVLETQVKKLMNAIKELKNKQQ